MNDHPLSVLVVDDTVVYRKILSDVVQDCPDTRLVGTAPSGRLALSKLEREPVDLVLLDVEMADMGGLETLAEIKCRWPGTAVVMISGANLGSTETTIEALENGALDFLPKPEGQDMDSNRLALLGKLRPLIRHVLTQRHLRQPLPEPTPVRIPPPSLPPPAAVPRPTLPTRMGKLEAVGIGISTGGPNALAELVPNLPADLGVPVFIVQHMPPGFTASLAHHLDLKSRLRVKEGEDGEPVAPGVVYIAPGGRHMILRRYTPAGESQPRLVIGLNDNPPENSCRPSVDVLFRSLATQYEGRLLAVVMTGMGSDGLEGVRTLKRQGTPCLTQSERTCVVYGMPQAVDEAGLSDESVPLPFLAQRITQLLHRTTGEA